MTEFAALIVLAVAAPLLGAAWFVCSAMNMGEADGLAGSRFHQKYVYPLLMPFYEIGRKTGIELTRVNMIGAGNE